MDKLFTPGKIGKLTIKNRAVLAPMQMMYGEHLGYAGEKAIAYYEERARGGVGLIIVEGVNVDEVNNKPWNLQMSLASDKYTASFQPLTEAIHKYDCRCFVQLHHYGAKSAPTAAGKAWAASEVPVAPGGPSAHKMTVEEIKIVEQRFIDAAVRAQKAGFDGVELAGSHGYLLHQFLSPYYNDRTDEYGGSIENCLRIYTEIVQGIKARLGRDFPVSVRFCGDEFTPHIPKTRTVEEVIASATLPIDLFGENHVQELVEKTDANAYCGKPGHFIGHLQTNKVNKVVGRAALIESVDSEHLLQKVERAAAAANLTQEILIEINIGGEESKSGISAESLWPLLDMAAAQPHIRLRGLMAIPPAAATPDETRAFFAQMRELLAKAADRHYENAKMDILSMGMSGDYPDAIREGATIVRIGTAIYGARDYSKKA